MRPIIAIPLLGVFALSLIYSCKHEPPGTSAAITNSNFPIPVANIFVTKCAISGCHNAASYKNADGLLLDTWDHLFNGDNSGACVVAYSPQYSPLMYFINTDASKGTVLTPTMPYNTAGTPLQPPLTADEYNAIYNWIASGAPDKNGNIPFGSNPAGRQKIYVTMGDKIGNRNILAVIDAEKKVVMRYIPVGDSPFSYQSPHDLAISGDGMSAYVCFIGSNYISKTNTSTDKQSLTGNLVGSTGSGDNQDWGIMCLAPDNSKLLLNQFSSGGGVITINPATMSVVKHGYYGPLVSPHGMAANNTFDTFYVTAEYGNTVYRLFSDPGIKAQPISIDEFGSRTTSGTNTDGTPTPDPHQIVMSPDANRYFVSCEHSNEVRVMDAHADTLIKVIKVDSFPQEITMSNSKPYIFVPCYYEKQKGVPTGFQGSVYVINYNTLEVVKAIYGQFAQPHEVAVDDRNGVVYVISTNNNGIATHHPVLGASVGWYNLYDLNTLSPINTQRYELLSVPYTADARFGN